MAEPENQTLLILRDIRESLGSMDAKFEKRFAAVDTRFDDMRKRLDNLRQAVNGESVLGRYAASAVDEQLTEHEKRLKALERKRKSP